MPERQGKQIHAQARLHGCFRTLGDNTTVQQSVPQYLCRHCRLKRRAACLSLFRECSNGCSTRRPVGARPREQQSPARIPVQIRKMEKYDDSTQAACRDSSDLDNLDDVCACAGAGSFSVTVSISGRPQWRRANSCRQNGFGASRWGHHGKRCLCGNGQR